MSGPGLKKFDTHHAIHQAAYHDAMVLTQVLRQLLQSGETQQAYTVAGLLVEHWLTRTLQHAKAEESGWYREIAAESSDLADQVIRLTRDHDLMSLLVSEIQETLAQQGFTYGIVERFEALLLINTIHNHAEEQVLLHQHMPGVVSPTLSGVFLFDHLEITESRPLSIVFPALYNILNENLHQCGINPGDLHVSVIPGADSLLLHIAYGDHFSQAFDTVLPSQATAAEVDLLVASITNTCEQYIQATYYEFMAIPDPAKRKKQGGIALTMRTTRSDNA